jgi:sulfate permease, SulP family
LAIILLLVASSRPHDAILGRTPGIDGFHDIQGHPEARTFPGLVIYRFDSSLLFFNSDFFKSQIRKAAGGAKTELRYFLLDAEPMSLIDTTGAATLDEVHHELAEKGVAFAIAGAKKGLRDMLDRTELTQQIGSARLFPTVESAVEEYLKGKR